MNKIKSANKGKKRHIDKKLYQQEIKDKNTKFDQKHHNFSSTVQNVSFFSSLFINYLLPFVQWQILY